jgi:hypothetical protein
MSVMGTAASLPGNESCPAAAAAAAAAAVDTPLSFSISSFPSTPNLLLLPLLLLLLYTLLLLLLSLLSRPPPKPLLLWWSITDCTSPSPVTPPR